MDIPAVGVNPLSWTNDVIEEFGRGTSAATFLADAATAGYAGVETGVNVPADPERLGPMLARHDLRLASGWHSGLLARRSAGEEMQAARRHGRLLAELGAKALVYGECGPLAADALDSPMSGRAALAGLDLAGYARRLSEFARLLAAQFGLQLAYHHHLMMAVETPAEIDMLMAATGPEVGLLLDTGHCAAGGGDVAQVLERHAERICHIHLKDVRAQVLADVRANDLSFNQGVRAGMFTVPGDGCIDFAPVASFVERTGYSRWLVVEAEQDPGRHPPLPTVTRARGFVREVFGL